MGGPRIDRAAIVLLLLYVCLLPLGWSPLPSNSQWADILFLALFVCTIATRPRIRMSRVDMLVLIYVVSSLPSFVNTTEPGSGIVPFVKHVYVALVYGVAVALTSRLVPPERLARWLAVVAVAVASVCLPAVAAYYVAGISVPWLGVEAQLPYVGRFYRLYGAFPSAEYLVNFLAFAAPLAILQVRRSEAGGWRRFWIVGVVAVLVAAFFTAGHGLGGLAAAVTFGLAREWHRRRPVLVAGVIAVTVALVLAVNVLLIVVVRDLDVITSRDMTLGQSPDTYAFHDEKIGDPRISFEVTYNVMGYWLLKQVAWEAFLREPLTGTGLGTFHNETRRAASENRIPVAHRELDPHSTWMGRLAETGIIGAAGLAALWIGMLVHAHRVLASSERQAEVAAAFVAGLIAVLVNSPNIDVMNFRFIWLAFGTLRTFPIRV